jgi:hypothetical protein
MKKSRTTKTNVAGAKVVAIDPGAHRLLKRWCIKSGAKMGAVASKLITSGVKKEKNILT